MRIDLVQSKNINEEQVQAVTGLARMGFGDSPSLLADTEEHIASATDIQLAYEHDQVVAFAMYRLCLWLGCARAVR